MLKDKHDAVARIQDEAAKHHDLTLQEQTQLNKQISEILLKKDGKNRCLFNPNDQIFQLEEETLMPTDEEKVKMVQQT